MNVLWKTVEKKKYEIFFRHITWRNCVTFEQIVWYLKKLCYIVVHSKKYIKRNLRGTSHRVIIGLTLYKKVSKRDTRKGKDTSARGGSKDKRTNIKREAGVCTCDRDRSRGGGMARQSFLGATVRTHRYSPAVFR